jgi:hypothetical protein
LYIGSEPSHVTDIAAQQGKFFLTRHGDVDKVVAAILEAVQFHERQPVTPFSKQSLLPQLIEAIEAGNHLQDFSSLQAVPHSSGGNQL